MSIIKIIIIITNKYCLNEHHFCEHYCIGHFLSQCVCMYMHVSLLLFGLFDRACECICVDVTFLVLYH